MCILFFVFGIITGWVSTDNRDLLSFVSEFGSFIVTISALLAVTLTIAYKEYLRFKKIKSLENICQLELEDYSNQIQDFFLFFQYFDGMFIMDYDEWERLKLKFPESPKVFTNYDMLLELETDFVTKITSLIRNRTNIKNLIRKIDDIYTSRKCITNTECKELITKSQSLQEQFCFHYNEVSNSNKFVLPENSIYHLLKKI